MVNIKKVECPSTVSYHISGNPLNPLIVRAINYTVKEITNLHYGWGFEIFESQSNPFSKMVVFTKRA